MRGLSGPDLDFAMRDLFEKGSKIPFQEFEWCGQGLLASDDDQISCQIEISFTDPPQLPCSTFQSVSIDRFHPSFYGEADPELVLVGDE